jgi:hypothetical protein
VNCRFLPDCRHLAEVYQADECGANLHTSWIPDNILTVGVTLATYLRDEDKVEDVIYGGFEKADMIGSSNAACVEVLDRILNHRAESQNAAIRTNDKLATLTPTGTKRSANFDTPVKNPILKMTEDILEGYECMGRLQAFSEEPDLVADDEVPSAR